MSYRAEHGSSALSSMNHKVNLTADEKTKLLTKYDPYDSDKKSKEAKSPLKQPSLFRAMFQVYGFELICLQVGTRVTQWCCLVYDGVV